MCTLSATNAGFFALWQRLPENARCGSAEFPTSSAKPAAISVMLNRRIARKDGQRSAIASSSSFPPRLGARTLFTADEKSYSESGSLEKFTPR